MEGNTSPHVDSLHADTEVDGGGAPAGLRPAKPQSTVNTTMTLLTVPWALCTVCLLVVVLYVNVHNFSIYGTLRSESHHPSVSASISHAQRDTARYALLGVSVAVLIVHVAVSYFLFRHAYHILRSVSASLGDLSVMVELLRTLHCGIFFFVDSVQRARCVEACGQYWVMAFSPFAEIRTAEAALNAVSLRLSTAPPEQRDEGAAGAGRDGRVSPPPLPSPSLLRSSQQSPLRHMHHSGGALFLSFADSPVSRSGWLRPLSPALDLSAVFPPPSPPSLSVSGDLAVCARPFRLALRRRHVALLQVSFLSYRQLAQGDAEAVAPVVAKFISAVLLCVRRFNAQVVELYADSAILSWNCIDASAGDYTRACVQCGYWLYEHLLCHVKEEETGAFFALAGYAGHVVCGSTTEGSYVLHGGPVAVLRELPALLEQRYCRYVWLGAAPPQLPTMRCVRWGTVMAGDNASLDVYAMNGTPDEADGCDEPRRPHVWHAPQWTTFGDECALAPETRAAMIDTAEAVEPVDTAQSSDVAVAAPAAPSGIGGLCPLETFHDHNNVLYQLSSTLLGESKSCVVRLALSHSGTLVAVKEIRIERGDVKPMRRRRCQREKRIVVATGDQLAFMAEVRMMERLHHTCIVGYISFQETHDRLRIVMEYVGGGNLLQFVTQDPAVGVDRPPVAVLLRSVLEGIAFLHRHSILHGDIKPQNVLVPDSGPCKLADFGISRRISQAATHPIEGTPFYMAPEATRGAASTASDIWSFGIMMAEVVTGRLPYDPDVADCYLLAQFMLGHDVERHLCTPLEPAALDVFNACTQYDPEKRKTANELLRMPYFAPVARGTTSGTP